MVEVNGEGYTGTSHSIKSAKHKASLKALEGLRGDEKTFECLDQDDNCKNRKMEIKSISKVYEEGARRGLVVEFEIVGESGPSHRKTFTTLCKVGELQALGKGKSKKESKIKASMEMLPQLKALPVPTTVPSTFGDGKKKKKPKSSIQKTFFDKIDKMVESKMDFGMSLFSGKSDDGDAKLKTSPFDDLRKLSRILKLNVDFTEYTQNGKTFSVLDMGLRFICLGEGINKKNSIDLASKHGINTLNKLGYLDRILEKESALSALELDEGNQKIHLELIREDQKDEL